jgi:hypothetical protein
MSLSEYRKLKNPLQQFSQNPYVEDHLRRTPRDLIQGETTALAVGLSFVKQISQTKYFNLF